MRRSLLVTAIVAVLLSCPAVQAKLEVGDPAPPLTITHWVKGEPQTLSKSGKIYVLDFWATWCVPCLQDIPKLTKMQKEYADQGVVVIGVTGPGMNRQTLQQVERFVRDQGDKMGYAIGWDKNGAMDRNYAQALGAMGIPYIVIVDRQGKIAWHGYSSPDVERVVEEMVAGDFDVKKEAQRAEKSARIDQLGPQYRMAAAMGNWDQALNILNQMAEIDPTRKDLLSEIYLVHKQQLNDPKRLRKWVETFIDTHQDDALALITVAKVLLAMESESPADRMPDLLLRAARQSYEVTDHKGVGALWVYARAAHRVGSLEMAIELQQQAVERAPKSLKDQLEKELEYYRLCKHLRDSQFGAPATASAQ